MYEDLALWAKGQPARWYTMGGYDMSRRHFSHQRPSSTSNHFFTRLRRWSRTTGIVPRPNKRQLGVEALEARLLLAIGPIIVDHNDTDITALSEAAINLAKADLHIAYGHTSHGMQITQGMDGLVGFANNGGLGLSLPMDTFAWNEGGTGGALDLREPFGYMDAGDYPQWLNGTRTYLDANPEVNVVMWGWCVNENEWWSPEYLMDRYLEPMTQLGSEYPDVTFVYTTSPAPYDSRFGYDAHIKQFDQSIRDYCIANNKVLYDFGALEHYDPNGTYFEFVADTCNYYESATGPLLGNWATEWQDSHTEGVDWYDCLSAHSQPLDANQKAYAAWALWTDIAVRRSEWDWGDAPSAPYPTLSVNDGARHAIRSDGPFMGGSVDAELDGQPGASALGDDNDGNDDDDGVTFTTLLTPGDPSASVDIDMSASPVSGMLNAWIDFNGDGDWADPGEQIFTDAPVTLGIVNHVTFSVPITAAPGSTFARFRVNTTGGLSYDGLAADGEVEDYEVQIGSSVDVYGTEGDDSFAFSTDGTSHSVNVNGTLYVLDASKVNESIRIFGGAGNETANLGLGSGDVVGPGYEVHVSDVEVIRVYAGGGDNDTAYLTGSAGDDRFVGYETYGYVSGDGFCSVVRGFDFVQADVTTGGDTSSDRAYLYDGGGNDTFYGEPDGSRMVLASGVENEAIGFDVVKAFASGGADHDEAYLTGSAGDDRFISEPDASYLTGTGFYNYAWGFDYVETDVTSGGDTSCDRAYLCDSTENDEFYGNPDSSWIVLNSGVENKAVGFDIVRAYASGGADYDAAYLTGSVEDDRFFGWNTHSYMNGPGFYNYVWGFDYVEADVAAGGDTSFDRANLYDSAGADTFTGQTTYGDLSGSGFSILAKSFDYGQAIAEERLDNDTANLYTGTSWHAVGDWENIIDLGPGSAGLSDLDFGFTAWIAALQDAEAASGSDGDTEEVDLASLDYVFRLFGTR